MPGAVPDLKIPQVYRRLFLFVFLIAFVCLTTVELVYVATGSLTWPWFFFDLIVYTAVISLITVASFLLVRRAVLQSERDKRELGEEKALTDSILDSLFEGYGADDVFGDGDLLG